MATAKQIYDAVQRATQYIDSLYKDQGTWAVMGEYPALPLSLMTYRDGTFYVHPCGWAYHWTDALGVHHWKGFWDFFDVVTAGERWEGKYGAEDLNEYFGESPDWDYKEPRIEVTYEPYSADSTKMRAFFGTGEWVGAYRGWLVFGDKVIYKFEGKCETIGINREFITKSYGRFPANRYTLRHGSQLASKHYWFDSIHPDWKDRALKLIKELDLYGFTYDIYDPIYRMSDGLDDGFFFTTQAYHDCDVYWDLPKVLHCYPYWSKVNLNRGLYIMESQFDPLINSLQAIHAMNKYNSPDKKDTWGPFGNTARGYLRTGFVGVCPPGWVCTWIPVEQRWVDGMGIEYPSGSYSTTRLAAFLIAEAEMGYGFGDSTAKTYADKAAEILLELQWGRHLRGIGETYEDGVINRPDHDGGFYVLYEAGEVYPFRLGRAGFLREFTDQFAMPPEFTGPVPTNLESTLLAIRALLIYHAYKYRGLTGRFPRLLIFEDLNADGKVDTGDLKLSETRKHQLLRPNADVSGDAMKHPSDLPYYKLLDVPFDGFETHVKSWTTTRWLKAEVHFENVTLPKGALIEEVWITADVYGTSDKPGFILGMGLPQGTRGMPIQHLGPYWTILKHAYNKNPFTGKMFTVDEVNSMTGAIYLQSAERARLGKTILWDFAYCTRMLGWVFYVFPYAAIADVDHDGDVDEADFLRVMNQLDRNSTPPPRTITAQIPTQKTVQNLAVGVGTAISTAAMIEIMRRAYRAWKR